MMPPNAGPTKAPDGSGQGGTPTDSPVGPHQSDLPSGPPDETPGAQSPDVPGTSASPPASAVPAGLQVLAILEKCGAGAPPAWSASGATLAFSAMPADGKSRPRRVLWSPSDSLARPVTTDHGGSYFASWSGEHIVASRVAAKGDSGTVQLRTIVLDPTTLAERVVAGAQLWLPVVNPSRRWPSRGAAILSFKWARGAANGTLGMVDWAALDPFAPGNEPAATPVPTEAPTASPAPPTDTPNPTPSAPATPASPGASPSSSASGSAAPPNLRRSPTNDTPRRRPATSRIRPTPPPNRRQFPPVGRPSSTLDAIQRNSHSRLAGALVARRPGAGRLGRQVQRARRGVG